MPLVASEVSAYRNAWLFALAMLLDINLHALDLSDRAAEAAFALVETLQGKSGQRAPGIDDTQMQMDIDGGQQAEEATKTMVCRGTLAPRTQLPLVWSSRWEEET